MNKAETREANTAVKEPLQEKGNPRRFGLKHIDLTNLLILGT